MTDLASQDNKVIVVGSGPSAVSACSALLDRGIQVTMIDADLEAHPKILELKNRLGVLNPSQWSKEDITEWKYKPSTESTIGLKSWFGSLHAYEVPNLLKVNGCETGFRASFARGGFSNVWGATILPYSERELRGFPLKVRDLEEHYRSVLSLMPFSAKNDLLLERYPLYSDSNQILDTSVTATELLERMSRRRFDLNRKGIEFGRARLAVQAADSGGENGCVNCGRCLDGCPYDYIWSSISTVEKFLLRPNFQLVRGFVVDTVSESLDGVKINGHDKSGYSRTLNGSRVLIAAGTVGSARILLKSGLVEDHIVLRDSQTIFAPFVWFGPRQKSSNRTATLSEVFISLDIPNVSIHPVQLQVYPSNDSLISRAQAKIPSLSKLFPMLRRGFDQVLPIVIYLHSEDSNSATATVTNGELVIKESINPRRAKVIGNLWKHLVPSLARIGLVGLPPLAEVAAVGEGFHTGASLPMSLDPGPGFSDLLGRPFGCQRIHLVDASVLSQIPAGPITFSVMANAHRIASQLAEMEIS